MKILEKIETGRTTYYSITAEIEKQKRKIQIEATLTEMYDENSGTQDYELNILNSDPLGYSLNDKQQKKLKELAINISFMKKLIGYCAVDSGQILLTDPCYLDKWKDTEAFDKKEKAGNYSYAGCCKKEKSGVQLKFKNGIKGAGVCVSSGYGDGLYPVYAEEKNGRIKKVEIIFINE